MKTFIREQYATPHEMRQWEEMGFIVEVVKPVKMNKIGYLVRLYGKGA